MDDEYDCLNIHEQHLDTCPTCGDTFLAVLMLLYRVFAPPLNVGPFKKCHHQSSAPGAQLVIALF